MRTLINRSAGAAAALWMSLGFAGAVLAQNGSPTPTPASQDQNPPAATEQAPQRGHRDNLLEGLNLSDDQKAQIKQIHQDAKAKIQATNADTTLSEDQKQAQYKQIHQATEKQVHMLLTPQQRKQLRAERQARAAARQQQAAPAQQAAPPQNQ